MSKLKLIFIIIISTVILFTLYKKTFQANPDDKINQTILKNVKKIGVADTYNYIVASNRKDLKTCNNLLHSLGSHVFQLYLKKNKFQMPVNAYDCDSGFYQGIYESFQSNNNQKSLQSLCDYLNNQNIPKTWDQCFFNLGHIFVEKERIGKKDESELASSAITICESVAQRTESRIDCVTGVFDAINKYYQSGKYGFKMNPEDPLNLCVKQNDTYRKRCYRELVSSLYQLTNSDLVRSIKYLESIKSQEEKYDVMATLASAVAWRDKDLNKMAKRCKSLDLKYQLPCITGFSGGLLEISNYGEEYQEALKYCQLELFTDIEKKACIKRLFSDYEVLYPGKAKAICFEKAGPQNNDVCNYLLKK